MEKNCFNCKHSVLRDPWENWITDGCTYMCTIHENHPIKPTMYCDKYVEKRRQFNTKYCKWCNYFAPIAFEKDKVISKCMNQNVEIIDPFWTTCENYMKA